MLNKFKKIISLSKKFPFLSIKKKTLTSFVVVKDLSYVYKTEDERRFYHELLRLSYYASPEYEVNGVRIDFAFIPYKLALIETNRVTNHERINRLLKRRGWNVIFYEAKKLYDPMNRQLYFKLIQSVAPLHLHSHKSTFE